MMICIVGSVFYVLVLNVFLVTICVLFAIFMPHVGRILRYSYHRQNYQVVTISRILRYSYHRQNSQVQLL